MTRRPSHPPASGTAARLAFAAAVVAAALPRLAHLLADTPSLDEWHPLLAVRREGFAQLAASFGLADRSIPVALYLESLTRTVGLSELGLRAPFALAGLAIVVALPLALRRRLGPLGVPLLAWILALCPLMIFFSRTIRPYGPAAALALVAVLAYRRYTRHGRRRDLVGFALAAGGVGWALPVHLPFCLALPGLEALRGRRRRRARTALVAASVLVVLALAPALFGDSGSLAARLAAARLDPGAWLDALRILAGARPGAAGAAVTGAVAVLVLAAGVALRRRRWVRDLALASAAQAGAFLIVRPLGIDVGLITARYLLPAGLAGAALVAAGAQRLAVRAGVRPALGVALVVGTALVGVGPLPGWTGAGPDNFASTRLQNRMVGQEPAAAGEPTPAYRRIAAEPPDSAAVLEVPFLLWQPRSVPSLQLAHRQRVHVGVTTDVCSRHHTFELAAGGRDGFTWDRFVALDDRARMERLGIRFVVFHREAEVAFPDLPARQLFYDFDRCVEEFRRRTGLEPFDDGRVALFDLAGPRSPSAR